jgi:hypothetical protein
MSSLWLGCIAADPRDGRSYVPQLKKTRSNPSVQQRGRYSASSLCIVRQWMIAGAGCRTMLKREGCEAAPSHCS